MKIENNHFFRILMPLLILMLILGSCSDSQSESEVQKLLEKQKTALDEGDELLEETFQIVQVLKDSLESAQRNLENRRSQVEEDLENLEADQLKYAETLKEDPQPLQYFIFKLIGVSSL